MVRRDAFFIRTPFFGLCPVYFFKMLPLNLEAILLHPPSLYSFATEFISGCRAPAACPADPPPPSVGPLRRTVPTLHQQCWGLPSAKVQSPEKTTEMLQAALRSSCWDARWPQWAAVPAWVLSVVKGGPDESWGGIRQARTHGIRSLGHWPQGESRCLVHAVHSHFLWHSLWGCEFPVYKHRGAF